MAKDPGQTASRPADREQLLRGKEAELARILDEHDDLVREQYHMETFVTMITGFDPAVVKHERGQDFERYARGHDLYLKHGHLLGPGRASRRRLPAPPPPPSTTPAKSKKLEHTKAVQAKEVVEPENRNPALSGRSRKASNAVKQIEAESPVVIPVKNSSKKGKSVRIVSETSETVEEEDPSATATGRGSKRKAGSTTSTPHRTGKRARGQPEERSPSPLLVSTAAFRLTCPEQEVEFNPRSGQSLESYLKSYVMLEEKDIEDSALRNSINSTAKTRERIRLFRKHGRMLGQLEEEPDSEEDVEGERGPTRVDRSSKKMSISAMRAFPEPKRLPDHKDHLLGHVTQVRNAMLVDWKIRTANARKIARAIQIYWDRELNKDDIAEKMEERRRKLVMRELVKAIKAKWQLAVNVVRSRRVAAEKAEQDRLGKEHLQEILERSRNLLGGQQACDESSNEADSDDGQTVISDQDDEEEGSGADIEDEDTEVETDVAGETSEEGEVGSKGLQRQSEGNEHEEEQEQQEIGEDLDNDQDQEEEEEVEDRRHEHEQRSSRTSAGEAEAEGSDLSEPDKNKADSEDGEGEGVGEEDEEEEEELEVRKHSPNDVARNGDRRKEPTRDSARAGSTIEADDGAPLPVEQDRPGRSRRLTSKTTARAEDPSDDPDVDDVEFAALDDVSDEDRVMDAEMEGDDAVMDSDDEEDEGLLADADMPLDELMAKYGYGSNPAAVVAHEGPGSESDDQDMEDRSDSSDGDGSVSDDEAVSIASSQGSAPDDSANPSMRTPFLIRANLRPYQTAGLEWLAQLYKEQRNAILADEMGLGKTLQTIALLAHLACDHGQWGPHLIVVPTSVILNWEMEFKKFLPGFKVLTYYGSQQERKDLRKGWLAPHAFEVLITSYQIVLADEFVFKRRQWQYLILDEAHNIKNFRSQRWQTLLGFRSERRLLLTGTPLQNNLMELWSLLYFLMPQGLANDEETGGFANHKEFNEWFSNPMEKAIELGGALSDEAKATVNRLHLILRPFILRRLKAEVETQLPGKFEHVIYCNLSKRQRYLYDEFMSRSSTRESLMTGGYLGVANCLMQLRKVCNHPDLFEVRAIRTSFAMTRSVVGEQEPIYTRVRTLLPLSDPDDRLTTDMRISTAMPLSSLGTHSCRRLDASDLLPSIPLNESAPAYDVRTIEGWKAFRTHSQAMAKEALWHRTKAVNRVRCSVSPVLSHELITAVRDLSETKWSAWAAVALDRSDGLLRSLPGRLAANKGILDRFAAMTPAVVANDLPHFSLSGTARDGIAQQSRDFDSLHPMAVKLQIAFPDRSLLQHDCGKLQELHNLLKTLKAGGHRVLIFTQMTRMLDILEIFLSHNGHRYSRLDGSTKVEDRLLVTERFNASPKIFALIASTRSGGVGINLTGADTVIFYDNEFNPAMDKQAMDRAHRIGQTREVHIYRLVTAHTVEENMLKKANQKRRLDDLIMQEGDFTTDYFAKTDLRDMLGEDILSTLDQELVDEDAAGKEDRIQEALAAAEDDEDAEAARKAYADIELDAPDFGVDEGQMQAAETRDDRAQSLGDDGTPGPEMGQRNDGERADADEDDDQSEDDEGGAIDDYLLDFVDYEWDDYFSLWKTKRTG